MVLMAQCVGQQGTEAVGTVSPRNFFGTVRQTISDKNSDIPLLCIKIFDTEFF